MLNECPDPDECANMHEMTEAYEELKRRIKLWDNIVTSLLKSGNISSGTMQALEFLQAEIKEMVEE